MVKVWIFLFVIFVLYSSLVYAFSDERPLEAGADAKAGQTIWQKSNCQSCHQIYGLGGYMGPDLTNVSKKGDAYVRAFLKRGTAKMPDFHFSEKEKDELVAFLKWIDSSGNTRVEKGSVHWTGSFTNLK